MKGNIIKTLYLLVITVISIVCVVVGVSMHIGGFEMFGVSLGNGSGNLEKENDTVTAFSSIYIDASVMELTVKKGDEYSFSYEATEGLVPTYKVKDGELKVTQKDKKTFFGNNKCKVIITIPQEKALDSVFADINVGDVTWESMEMVKLTAELNVGDLNIQDITTQDMIVTCDTGDIDIKDCTFTTLDIDANVGDVDVKSAQSLEEYAFDVETDIGEVTVNGENEKREYQKDGEAGKVTLKADVGDVEIQY